MLFKERTFKITKVVEGKPKEREKEREKREKRRKKKDFSLLIWGATEGKLKNTKVFFDFKIKFP